MRANNFSLTRAPEITASQQAMCRWHDPNVNDDVIQDFTLHMHAQRLSVNTVRNRVSILHSFARTLTTPLVEASPADLRRFIGGKDVKVSSARVYRLALLAFYRFAVDEGYCANNPAERLPVVRVPRGVPRPFTIEQIDAMLNSGAYKRTRVMIMLGYYQGFRVSQIARVRGDDIDPLSGTIRTVAKGGKERHLPLHPIIREVAADMPQSWWFPARDGSDSPIKPQSVTNLITKAKQRAGITDPTLTPHSLRHAFGSELVEHGVDIRVVQELMLHEDLGTTQVYTRVSEHRKTEGILALPVMQIPVQALRKAA